MKLDRYRLEYEIKSRGWKIKDFCEKTDINRSVFYKKLRGESEFTLSEIQRILDVLGLDSPMGIFFADKVS